MDDTQGRETQEAEAREPETQDDASWPPWRRRLTGTIVALVLIGLVAYVPGPIMRIIHTNNAHELVDSLPVKRDALLAMQDEFSSPLEQLGDPVRSWTEVICSLSPQYSDGDGEQDVVMLYWQECSLRAIALYPVPDDLTDGASVAAWLGGETADDPKCGELIFDVLTPDVDQVDPNGYTALLWWTDPDGTPPENQPDRCSLVAPGGPNTAHTTVDVDEPLTAGTYLVYTVMTPAVGTGVGCRNALSTWLGNCASEPDGFPVM